MSSEKQHHTHQSEIHVLFIIFFLVNMNTRNMLQVRQLGTSAHLLWFLHVFGTRLDSGRFFKIPRDNRWFLRILAGSILGKQSRGERWSIRRGSILAISTMTGVFINGRKVSSLWYYRKAITLCFSVLTWCCTCGRGLFLLICPRLIILILTWLISIRLRWNYAPSAHFLSHNE